MLPEATTYAELYQRFTWDVPEFFNMGVAVCDRWADQAPDRLALTYVDDDGVGSTDYTFSDLRDWSNRLANLLHALGVERGDRVSILLPQTPATAFSHIAIHKLGAISIPLFTLFGVDALQFRLHDSGSKVVITDAQGAEKLASLRGQLPQLRHVLVVDANHDEAVKKTVEYDTFFVDLAAGLAAQSTQYTPATTRADDPAMIIYTSGTTGQPKGALHAHRVLLGHLPGVEMSHDLFPQPGDKIWTPADWAWIGGLLDVLMPALYHGVPVVACRFAKFTGEAAFDVMARFGVRNVFLPPTALKIMRAASGRLAERTAAAGDTTARPPLLLRSVASGGETLGKELLEWGREVLGVTINEFYGQTECNMIVSSCAALLPERPGVMGCPVPGHQLAIVSEHGERLPAGTVGNIAVHRPDPVLFLRYWNNPAATTEKFRGDWLITGDTGIQDEQGWIQFVGRDDDVITSSGYRIGPGEIEDCLISHPAVKLAGVVGKPDPQRTEIVVAFVVLMQPDDATDVLAEQIQLWVKQRLAAHEYPRRVQFVAELPMTATGKIIRRELRSLAERL